MCAFMAAAFVTPPITLYSVLPANIAYFLLPTF
jgi:hypothetical protein